MRHLALFLNFALIVLFPAGAQAQSEADRLREALRTCTAQTRSAEDQRAVLQARLGEAERERDRLRRQSEILRAQVREAEQAYAQAVKDFNERLGERDEALEKWKNAYNDAATVARSKDAERTKFEQEATALKASNKSCEAKNVQLQKVGQEILGRYQRMDPLEALVVQEPVLGIKRVEHQNSVQDFRNKLLDQKVKP
jgi:chromosome segregation ATPase